MISRPPGRLVKSSLFGRTQGQPETADALLGNGPCPAVGTLHAFPRFGVRNDRGSGHAANLLRRAADTSVERHSTLLAGKIEIAISYDFRLDRLLA